MIIVTLEIHSNTSHSVAALPPLAKILMCSRLINHLLISHVSPMGPKRLPLFIELFICGPSECDQLILSSKTTGVDVGGIETPRASNNEYIQNWDEIIERNAGPVAKRLRPLKPGCWVCYCFEPSYKSRRPFLTVKFFRQWKNRLSIIRE